MNIGERIRARRKQLKLTAEQLGRMIGKDRATVYRYEKNEIENMSISLLTPLAKALNIPESYLMGWDNKVSTQLSTDYCYYPDVKVSAGIPLEIESVEAFEKISISDELLGKHAGSKDIFFMRVNGESMNKVIPHDSLIAVKKAELHDFKDGDIVVYSNDHDYAVKRFYDLGDDLVFKPESDDPSFTDDVIKKSSEDLIFHGKIVTYIVNLD